MIADAILAVIFAPFEWVLGQLPDSALTFGLPSGLMPVSQLFAAILDLEAVASTVALIVSIETAFIVFDLAYLIYRKFPGIGPG